MSRDERCPTRIAGQESGGRRRRRPEGAWPTLAAGIPEPSGPRRREKPTASGQWESNHAHAAGPVRFTAAVSRAVG